MNYIYIKLGGFNDQELFEINFLSVQWANGYGPSFFISPPFFRPDLNCLLASLI
jgi:hypothetical protein